MVAKFIKIMALIIIGFSFINSCQINIPDTPDTPDTLDSSDTFDISDISQVYKDNRILYKGYSDLIGVPLIPASIFDIPLFQDQDSIFKPGTSTIDLGDYPWTITGKITNGKMDISFPDEKFELDPNFESSFTEGVRICIVYIEDKYDGSMMFGLHKISPAGFGRVYIYYSSDDFIKPRNKIALKAGWNFIEEIENPNWSFGSDEPYRIMGLISQDINYFLSKGYRWQMEMWF